MFKATMPLTQESDINDVVNKLIEKMTSDGVNQLVSQEVVERFRLQIEPILDHGKSLFEIGSKMSLNSTVNGDGYNILVKARFGIKDSFWRRLFSGS